MVAIYLLKPRSSVAIISSSCQAPEDVNMKENIPAIRMGQVICLLSSHHNNLSQWRQKLSNRLLVKCSTGVCSTQTITYLLEIPREAKDEGKGS